MKLRSTSKYQQAVFKACEYRRIEKSLTKYYDFWLK
jgi:hypothetical protein